MNKTITSLCMILLILLFTSVKAGTVLQTNDGNIFEENFIWQGNHAATILSGSATTVWWDEASWDVRADTSFVSVESQGNGISNLFHLDIHKALSSNPTIGTLSNTQATIGGDGEAGVGVMHLDFQDILSARLRNPLLISEETPGIIEFYASAFVTTGHWWEIALTPADKVIGAEHSSVPGQGESGLPGALGGDAQPGPGHSNPLDSINLVSFGATDVPCITDWWTRFGVTKTADNITTHFVNQVGTLNELTQSNPADADKLEHWRIQISPNQISLFIDSDDNNQFNLVESWPVSVTWPEVYVHLMAVAYQADHHPQEPCYLGHIRELKWRNIKIYPVRDVYSDVYPKNNGIIQVGKNQGWLEYDIRDIQRFGPAVNGAPQPNLSSFSSNHNGRYCNDAGFPCFGNDTNASLSLLVPETPTGFVLSEMNILADLKNSFSSPEMPVSVTINMIPIGTFDTAESSLAVEENSWVRRGLTVPVLESYEGSTLQLGFTLGNNAYLDRLEVEFLYQLENPSQVIFKDSFE